MPTCQLLTVPHQEMFSGQSWALTSQSHCTSSFCIIRLSDLAYLEISPLGFCDNTIPNTLLLTYFSPLYWLTPCSLTYFLPWQQQPSIPFSQAQITYISAAQPILISVFHKYLKYRLVIAAVIFLPAKYCSPWRFLKLQSNLISQTGTLKGSLTSPSPMYPVSQELFLLP